MSHDPSTGAWRQAEVIPSSRGVAALDSEVWVAHTGGLVSRLDRALATLDSVDLTTADAAPLESIGVGVDGLGRVWVASSHGGPGGVGVASRVDPTDGSVAHVPVGLAPHTQGDLTGAELVGGFVPEGSASEVFEGCPLDGDTEWLRLHLAADAGVAGTIEVAVRHAATVAELAAVAFVIVGVLPDEAPPFDLDVPDGGVLEVRLTLRTAARDGSPRVRRVGIEWGCPGPG
jgi:hypothetical protein